MSDQPLNSASRIGRIPEITITVGAILAIGVVALTVAYVELPEKYQPALLFFAAACAAAGQLAAALYAARVLQLSMNIQAQADNLRVAKIDEDSRRRLTEKSDKFIERWNDATLFHVRQHCQELIDKRNEPEEIRKLINSSPSSHANVRHILNFLEEIALCVNQKRCDAEILRTMFSGIVVNVWHATEFFVKEQRTHRGRPRIWAELEALYQGWK